MASVTRNVFMTKNNPSYETFSPRLIFMQIIEDSTKWYRNLVHFESFEIFFQNSGHTGLGRLFRPRSGSGRRGKCWSVSGIVR
jgi:hypothetical protein